MKQNKTRKYLKYAIGEIILVMVGILLALQVNNWNEKRKLRIVEKDVLRGILNDITRDTIDINYNIRQYQMSIKNDSLLLDNLVHKKGKSELVERYIAHTMNFDLILTLHTSSYDEAKQNNLISNNNNIVWDRISRLYNFHYPVLLNFENEWDAYNTHKTLFPILRGVFEIDSSNITNGVPNISKENYSKLLSNKNIHFEIRRARIYKQLVLNGNDSYNSLLIELIEIIDIIKKELKS